MRDDLYMMWDEEEEIKCPHCHLMFIKEALREHIDSCHSYACTKCESSYCYGYYLKSVIISSPHHRQPPPFSSTSMFCLLFCKGRHKLMDFECHINEFISML